MGVPSFYRWLSKKYPRIVRDVVEEARVTLPDGSQAPIDYSKSSPNGFEIDNLYLDMNGIIHPCCHPEEGDQPGDEETMIARIFLYIDRIFAMVRPRQLLYMAIDGVAPRAKMNQQRSRRFRSAKEVTDKEEAEDALRKEWVEKGLTPPPRKPRAWDSNVITPGTPFMAKLSRAIHWYIYDRLSHDLGWRGCKVIFSDAKVPGEGEHKIMNYIRLQRAAPGYDPNTYHCLYGMDADLIMLGLATHNPHFCILRETITDMHAGQRQQRCFMCGVDGHRADQCSGIVEEEKAKALESGAMAEKPAEPGLMEKPFQFLMLNVLREYLAHDMYVPGLPFAWDLERAIDDFVFLAFFVGNDFLPHLPLLEIREGAIERLVGIWKRLLPSLGGFISEHGGQLNLSRVDVLLTDLGVVEDSIFKSRRRQEEYIANRDANKSSQLSARRAQTLKARESQKQFAEEQGFTAAKSGIRIEGTNVQPHIKAHNAALKGGVKTEVKPAITQDDGSGDKPVYSQADLPLQVVGSKKRKAGEAASSSATGAAEPVSDEDQPPRAKVKLEPGVEKPVKKETKAKKAKKKKQDEEEESEEEEEEASEYDSDDDPNDKSYKPTGADAMSDVSSSASDSDDSDDDKDEDKATKKSAAKLAKSKSRRAKQSAQRQAKASSKEKILEAQRKIKHEDNPAPKSSSTLSAAALKAEPVDNLRKDHSGKLLAALDAEAAHLDFGAILNAKLRALERPPERKRRETGEEGAGAEEEEAEEEAQRDPVRFGEEGWKPRYYSSKMHIERDRAEDAVIFHKLFKSYAEGLAWVMQYYYAGCPSWSWYYPYHYAPMASDLSNLDRYKIEFDLSKPFTPIGQLMGVLPGKSAHALPAPCQELMLSATSPIIDFYPDTFALDLNGKRAMWQAVALLPWIEEKRLLHEIEKIEPKFNDEEKERNRLGVEYLFIHKSHLLANSVYALYAEYPPEDLKEKTQLECAELKKEPIDPTETSGMSGFMSPYVAAGELDGELKSEVGLPTVTGIEVLSVIYHLPPHRPHRSVLLPGLLMPPPVLTEKDLEEQARGGPQQHDRNQSRNNQQRYQNQRESNRQPQGGQFHSHGGQAVGVDPRFGSAPSHFQQGDVSGGRIWNSGFNQKGGQQQGGAGAGRGGVQQGGGGRGGYQQNRGGYQGGGQQGYQQPYQQQGGGYQVQQGGYQAGGNQSSQYPAPPAPGTYPQAPQAASMYYQPPVPAAPFPMAPQQPQSFSHARGGGYQQQRGGGQQRAQSGNPQQFAALQQQIQANTAQRAYQHQGGRK